MMDADWTALREQIERLERELRDIRSAATDGRAMPLLDIVEICDEALSE